MDSKFTEYSFSEKNDRSMAYESLRRILKEEGQTQRALADAIGVSAAAITELFGGRRGFYVHEAIKAANWLRRPLLEIVGYNNIGIDKTEKLSEIIRIVIECFKEIPGLNQHVSASVIVELAKEILQNSFDEYYKTGEFPEINKPTVSAALKVIYGGKR